MSTTRVDSKYRIIIDKRIRSVIPIKAGDTLIIEPVDNHSFKVKAVDLATENVEDDPGWKAFHPPAKVKKKLSLEELNKLMEETTWLE